MVGSCVCPPVVWCELAFRGRDDGAALALQIERPSFYQHGEFLGEEFVLLLDHGHHVVVDPVCVQSEEVHGRAEGTRTQRPRFGHPTSPAWARAELQPEQTTLHKVPDWVHEGHPQNGYLGRAGPTDDSAGASAMVLATAPRQGMDSIGRSKEAACWRQCCRRRGCVLGHYTATRAGGKTGAAQKAKGAGSHGPAHLSVEEPKVLPAARRHILGGQHSARAVQKSGGAYACK